MPNGRDLNMQVLGETGADIQMTVEAGGDAAAVRAEKWANGTANGVPVPASTNPNVPTSENNAKYWANQAQSAASDAAKYPKIENGYWYYWNGTGYVNSGVSATWHIVKTYASTSAMNSDFGGTDTKTGDMVMIVNNVDETTNAQIYVKGNSAWQFLVDLSGATGIQGPRGATGATPVLTMGTVTTLPTGSDATASFTGTNAAPVLNLGIPKGQDGNEIIDDTAGDGDTDKVWSANKVYDELVLKAPKASPEFTGSISLGRKANTSVGNNSFAVGVNVEASGDYSHAEGSGTIASGHSSHAEGGAALDDPTVSSTASGRCSHAEGSATIASGDSSHSEGIETTASGYASHAEGFGTYANKDYQSVFGKNNVPDGTPGGSTANGTYVEIVGNGTTNLNKSNARTLDWDGNERLMGDLYINCNGDSTGGMAVSEELSKRTKYTDVYAGVIEYTPIPNPNFVKNKWYHEVGTEYICMAKRFWGRSGSENYHLPTESNNDFAVYTLKTYIDSKADSTTVYDLSVNKADLIEETLSTPASVMTFSDGANDLPMALTVGIAPVQDLHGYESPWVWGAGKNLLPMTVDDIKALNTGFTWSGNTGTSNNVSYTIKTDDDGNVTGFDVKATTAASDNTELILGVVKRASNTNYFVSGCPSGGSTDTYRMTIRYISNGSQVQTISDTGSGNYVESSTQTTADSIRIGIRIASGITVNKSFLPMVEVGDSGTTFAPYSNICPISGWTGAKIKRFGNNIASNVELHNGVINASTGAISSGNNRLYSDEMIVSAGTYIIETVPKTSNVVRIWDTSGNFISNEGDGSTWHENGRTITFTEARRIRIMFSYNGEQVAISPTEIQSVRVGDNISVYSIAFPQSAGTVYGGTLTVNKDGSGSLVVTRAKVTYDGDEGWSVHGTYASWFYRNMESDCFVDENRNGEAISDSYAWDDYTNVGNIENGHFSYGRVSNQQTKRIVFKDTNCTTVAEWEAYLAQKPVTVIYRLSDSILIPLTAPQVKTLLGYNTVYADTGDMLSITYPADTKLYIDKKFAELSSVITALGT